MPILKLLLQCFVVSLFLFPGHCLAFQSAEKINLPAYLEPERYRQKDSPKTEAHDLIERVRMLAEELYENLEDSDPLMGGLSDGLLVCTFVEINKLYRTSSFGRYVAGQLLNEFQRYDYPVIDMRKSTSVMVQEKRGEYGLSRDPDEIAPSQTAGAMLTGTYLVGENEIIVNARILDNKKPPCCQAPRLFSRETPWVT